MSRFCMTLLLFLSPVLVLAQTPDTASVRGQVLDQSRAAVAAVDVEITNTLTGSERVARTDASGNFSFSGLPAGSYTLKSKKEKFVDFQREMTLVGGTTADVQLQLNVSGGATDIVVTGALGKFGLTSRN